MADRHKSDSVWQKDLKITDTAAARSIERIQDMNSTLNNFNDVVDNGYDSTDISENLPGYEQRLKLWQVTYATTNNNLSLSRLSYVQNYLQEMAEDLQDWQKSLLSYYTEVVGMNTQMRTLLSDSSEQSLPTDSTLRVLYLRQYKELKKRLHGTDTVLKKDILKVDLEQTRVSNDFLEVVALQKQVGALIKSYRKKAFSKESGYLWEGMTADSSSSKKTLSAILSESVRKEVKVLGSYLPANWEKYIFNLPILLIFFFWTLLNINKIKRSNPAFLNTPKYVQVFPLLASLVIMFIISPYYDLQHPPSAYLFLLQLLLVITLTMLLSMKWPRQLFFSWVLLLLLFVFFGIKSQLVNSTYYLRMSTFFVSILSIFIGFRFIRQTRKYSELFPSYFGLITGIYIVLNALAAGCNFYGRATLAHIFETTAIFNYVEAIGLIVFIQVFLDAVNIQLEADRKSTRFTAYLDYQNVELRLRRLLTVIAGIFWFVNLAQNLNVYNAAYDYIADFMGTERVVGSASFTFGSIVVFFFVIWVANFFQKYIGYFFGDTGNDDIVADKKPKLGTSILLVRLLILTAGFFVGILASGIPLDKVTLVIGALGVGIGLGLQNIVNNLVSGVILAIERPIQVGDIIEIGSSTGKVKDIGIRSSRIVTADGAEIIVPNGDMLSQKLTNWTLNNTHQRTELNIKLSDSNSVARAKELVSEILQNDKDVLKNPEPQILFASLNQSGAELQVLFWAIDINKSQQLKSDVLLEVYQAFSKESITIV